MKKRVMTEDELAVWIGLVLFILSLGVVVGWDLLGWGVSAKVWLDPARALAPVSGSYAGLPGLVSLAMTFVFLAALLGTGAFFLNIPPGKFLPAFTLVFWISYGCFVAGHFAFIAATPDQRGSAAGKFDIDWSLGLTGEAGYIVALVVGLAMGNFFPGITTFLKEACRPEWFIKTAIVILGASLGVKAAARLGMAQALWFRGFAAIVEAYLIYWALIYFIARKFFKFSREWAAPLASGISICGVSAAIATGAAIRARPIVPIMVSSLVVIFSVVELLVLPFAAQAFLGNEPMVAGAWMGLAVKTDGAAIASGTITESLIRSSAAGQGIHYEPGWILATTTTVKVFIDVFIGIWAFVLALIWVYRIDPKPGEKVRVREIWERFPKFVLGYFLTFLLALSAVRAVPGKFKELEAATAQADVFRGIFFAMTFFTIGLVSNFRKLWQEGIGRLALVYVVGLFGFVVWIGLLISWLFFGGARPPVLAGG